MNAVSEMIRRIEAVVLLFLSETILKQGLGQQIGDQVTEKSAQGWVHADQSGMIETINW